MRNKVGIAVGFLFFWGGFFAFFLCPLSRNHSPISPSRRSLIGCAAAKAIGEIRAFNGTVLFKEAKKACCLLFRASSSRLSEEGGGGGERKNILPECKKKKKKEAELQQRREKGVARVTIKARRNGWRESRRARLFTHK